MFLVYQTHPHTQLHGNNRICSCNKIKIPKFLLQSSAYDQYNFNATFDGKNRSPKSTQKKKTAHSSQNQQLVLAPHTGSGRVPMRTFKLCHLVNNAYMHNDTEVDKDFFLCTDTQKGITHTDTPFKNVLNQRLLTVTTEGYISEKIVAIKSVLQLHLRVCLSYRVQTGV